MRKFQWNGLNISEEEMRVNHTQVYNFILETDFRYVAVKTEYNRLDVYTVDVINE